MINVSWFYNTILTNAVYKCPEKLKRLGELLDNKSTEEFWQKCNNYDVDGVNKMIDDAFEKYLGSRNEFINFNTLINECPNLNINIENISLEKKVIEISKHSTEIYEAIKKSYSTLY